MTERDSSRRWIRRTAVTAGLAALLAAGLALQPARTPAFALPDDLSVDLHAHLFMREGMPLMFRGEFNGPLHARSWRTRFASQANPETVDLSRIGVLVVALYAYPPTAGDRKESIRKQIALAEAFVAEHADRWVLARDAGQARQAVALGKRVMVLSLEGADGILDTEADLEEFVDRRGIRIVTFLHLSNNELGGVAFLPSYHVLSTPFRWFAELFHPTFADGTRVNTLGLSPKGRALAEALIRHKVWIDLSHSSDATQTGLIPLIEAAGMPLLYTHGGLRRFEKAERGVSDEQLAAIRRTGGILGLCPSEDTLGNTRVPPERCDPACAKSCDGGFEALLLHYQAAAEIVGGDALMLGSDFNGAVPHLHPACGTGTSLDQEGLWNIAQVPELWSALRKRGAPVPARLSSMVQVFIDKWARVTGG